MADDEEQVEPTDAPEGEAVAIDGEEDPKGPDPGPLEYNPDEVLNLAPVFAKNKDGLEALKEISEHCKQNVKAAQDAAAPETERMQSDIGVYLGEPPQKDAGFDNAANVHLPIMLKTITRLSARVCGELFADWKNFVVVLPTSIGEDEKAADALSKHTNWQLANQIPDFQRQAEIGVDYFFLYGDVTCHSTYDPVRRQNRHEMLTPDEFIVPAVKRTTQPDYSDVPYRARIMHYYRHDLEARRDVWFDVDRVLDGRSPSWDDEPEEKLSREGMEVSGIEPTEETDATPYKVIWYEGWLDLPNQPAPRFCKVLFEYESGCIFELGVHEQTNWQDAQRYDKQWQELMAYRQAVQAYQAQQSKMQEQLSQMGDMAQATSPLLPDQQMQRMQMAQQAQQQLQTLTPPPPPQWASDADNPDFAPEPPRKEPIHLFAHAVCIEPPAGPRGVSFGRIEADFNRAGDTALSQFIDAASLSNCKAFLAAEGVEFKEKSRLRPGSIMHITGYSGTDLKEAMTVLEFEPGNPQLVQVAQMCSEMGEEAIQSPGVLVGEAGKSGETARGYGMRVEQATKQLTSSARKIARFFVQVMKNNAALNAKFLPEEELIAVQDPDTAQWQMLQMGRKLYERNYLVEFRTDMTFSSKAQRIAEADGILQLIGGIPPLQTDMPLIQYAIRKALEARGYKDYAQFLGPQMPPPQTPLGIQPPAPPGAAPPGAPAGQAQPGALPPGQSPGPAPKGQPSPPAPKPPPAPGETPQGPAR
jgi:hypothetical protein